jgi:hypothetical protein
MVDTPIVSEALQKVFRTNFPSQINSGRDLHVSDVVLPIVDFSTTAGVTGLSVQLQESLSFGNQTVFAVNNTTSTIINTPGFWLIRGALMIIDATSTPEIVLNDGSTDKSIYKFNPSGTTGNFNQIQDLEFRVFLRSGDSVKVTMTSESYFNGSVRQLADISGTLVNPTGYTGE